MFDSLQKRNSTAMLLD